jgi:hypothetical protein
MTMMHWRRQAGSKGVQAGAFILAILLLFYFWEQNYNKLANFYDYSIMAAAAGNLAAGLLPHRDFASVAQPLSLWVARGCELLFGQRYLALAYGNLALSAGLFLLIIWYGRKAWSYYLALLVALATTVASTLQHGIVWYNSIGMVILIAITLKGADMVRRRSVSAAGALAISFLLILGGLNKINFHVLDLGVVLFLGLVLWVHGGPVSRGKAAAFLLMLLICAVAPVVIETLWTHTTVSTWLNTILLGPGGRVRRLRLIATPGFYLKAPPLYYSGALHPALVGFGLLTYILIFAAAIQTCGWKLKTCFQSVRSPVLLAATAVVVFFGVTCVVISTNTDMQTLTGSYFMIGATAIAMLCAPLLGDGFGRLLRRCCAGLAVYFLIFGGICCIRHARLSYLEPAQFDATPPIAEQLPSYLQGVHLSEISSARLAAIQSAVRQDDSANPPFWGPGLGLMSRIYGGVSSPAIPLWYHLGVSVYESSAPALIAAIEDSPCSSVICDPAWFAQFPTAVRRHLETNWAEERGPLVVVFHRKRPGALSRRSTVLTIATLAKRTNSGVIGSE